MNKYDQNVWENAPFSKRIGMCNYNDFTELPFGIYASTQEGFQHYENSLGNQDSVNIVIKKDYIICCLSDGCSLNGSSESINEFSNNEVGATILSTLIIKETEQILKKYTKKTPNSKYLIKKLNNNCYRKINAFCSLIASQENRKSFIFNNLMATINLIIIFKNKYFIINSGDGFIVVNENIRSLKKSSGYYFSNNLIAKNYNKKFEFNILFSGDISEINSIALLTDGMEIDNKLIANYFTRFIQECDFTNNSFEDMDFLFRSSFLNNVIPKFSSNAYPKDDASFIIIKKTSNNA